jgi:hypothetical protein
VIGCPSGASAWISIAPTRLVFLGLALPNPAGCQRSLAIGQRRSFPACALKPQTSELGDSLELHPVAVGFENGRPDLLRRSIAVNHGKIFPYAHGFGGYNHFESSPSFPGRCWDLPQM